MAGAPGVPARLDGRGRPSLTLGYVRFLHQLQALHHAEAVLFVHDDQAEIFEFDAVLNQRVRSDDELRVSLRDVAADVAFAVLFERAGQQHDAVSGSFENLARGKIMLLRQNFGRRHERDLVAVFNRDDRRLEGHDRFARSHVALQQTPHGAGRLHVGGDFFQHPLLRGRSDETAISS